MKGVALDSDPRQAFDIEFTGNNSHRKYSMPIMIECKGSTHYEVINITAQTTSLDFSIQPIIPYSEAYLVIQGDHYIDEHNGLINVIAVPHGFNAN